MPALSDKKFPPCKVGNKVRVKIPVVDRGREGFPNILKVILECNDDGFYIN